MIKGLVENVCAYFRSAKALLSIRNTWGRSGEMSNTSNLLPVFSCSLIIEVGNSPECYLSTGKLLVGDRLWDSWWQSSDVENRITLGCFVPWCNVSHCLIWHSAATQLFGFVTFCGPSAPVPPIVPEFSIFGKKLDSLNWCAGRCF